ncbi:MAG: ParM/StbA family protein [Firmicutes bacterium]|nr:ParM/StbA family protein [Bacillota bacterium]
MHLTPVGLDSGYSYMKAISQTKEIVFPNIVSPGREITDEGLNDILGQTGVINNLDISFAFRGTKKHYWIGKMATASGGDADYFEDRDRWNSERGRASALAALALICRKDNENFVLATGLPLEDYKSNKTTLKQTYEKTIPGTYEVTFESGPLAGQTKRFNILTCKVYPQGLGVFFDQVLTDDGIQKDVHPLLEDGTVHGLIDVGRRTTNMVLFDDFNLSKDFSKSINRGIAQIHEQIQNFLSAQNRFVKNRDIEVIFKRDIFKGLDIKRVREEALFNLAGIIRAEAQSLWQDKALLESIYIAGGAGQAVYNFLNFDRYEKILVSNPQFANARGFYKAMLNLILSGKADVNGQYTLDKPGEVARWSI